MYSNMCFEDVAALRRNIDDLVDNCERSGVMSDLASACLLERLHVAQSIIVSVEEAIREQL